MSLERLVQLEQEINSIENSFLNVELAGLAIAKKVKRRVKRSRKRK